MNYETLVEDICNSPASVIYFTAEEWRKLCMYRTPIETIWEKQTWWERVNNKDRNAIVLGGDIHPIFNLMKLINGKRMICNKEIRVEE